MCTKQHGIPVKLTVLWSFCKIVLRLNSDDFLVEKNPKKCLLGITEFDKYQLGLNLKLENNAKINVLATSASLHTPNSVKKVSATRQFCEKHKSV